MILFYSWRELLVNNDEHPENKEVHWLLKPFLVLFRFLVATIPQTITMIQVIVIMVMFNKYKNLIYNSTGMNIDKSKHFLEMNDRQRKKKKDSEDGK